MKLAVVQIRGLMGMNKKFTTTFQSLKLIRKNSCVIIDDTRDYLGMLIKLKDHVTWGEIDQETFKALIEKRGRVAGNKALTQEYLKDKAKMDFNTLASNVMDGKLKLRDVPGLKPFFRLTPPRGGFDKEGIKKQYSLGGTLGYRGKEINSLIRRML
ncbi:MAG TPA: 50S ribosomal protein L30 [Candidatus Nanoarchaeia archaeon]|nr:50S ribosomal protein L30 [Candidatus Nanoarchaeia archaeon]